MKNKVKFIYSRRLPPFLLFFSVCGATGVTKCPLDTPTPTPKPVLKKVPKFKSISAKSGHYSPAMF